MQRCLRRTGRLTAALLVVIALLSGSAARADGLLEAMLDIALRAGRAIEATVSVDAEALLANMETVAGEEELAAVITRLLNDGVIRVLYAKDDDCDVISMAFEVKGQTIINCEARASESAYELTTNLLPGKTIIIPVQTAIGLMNQQTSELTNAEFNNALAEAAVKYIAITEAWAADNADIFTVNESPAPASQPRDAAARSETFRVTDAQWQDLLRLLADEFMKDDALLRELAAQSGNTEPEDWVETVSQFINALGEPIDCFAEATIYYGDEGQIVGMDARLEAPEEMPRGIISYGHLTIGDERSGNTIDGSFSWGEGYKVVAHFSYSDQPDSPILHGKHAEYYGKALVNTPSAGAFELTVLGIIAQIVEPIEESYDHRFNLRLSQMPDANVTNDLTQLLQAPLLDVGFTIKSRTEAIVMDDFLSEGSFTLKIMGQEAAINYTLKSIIYEPVSQPDNTIIEFELLSPEETEALTYEALQNLMQSLQTIQKLYED